MNKTRIPPELTVSANQFPIVGIGASAGGLEAVKQFLQAVPPKSGMAYVFVQHLNPNHESALVEILAKVSKIPVQQITNNIHLAPDHFYILPNNKIVTATDGVLKLAPLDDKHNKVKIIDLFFSSLAIVHQSYAVGVVLSGMLADGTLGLEVIKAYGGITFAPDEASAAFDDMPKNAIRSGLVDFVMPPAEIAAHLMTINVPFHPDYSKSEIADTVPQKDEEVFKQLLTVLRVRRGVDFTYYKTSTLKRRIVRRMALTKIEEPIKYLSYLRENKPEQDALYNDMLISVTHFFRDPGSFELISDTILPEIISHKTGDEPLRIWVAGCATGEEAYSMAMSVQEQLVDKAAAMKIQVFASDISETAIAKARSGIYRPTDLEGLSGSRLEQFFTKIDGNYQVNKVIRDMCVFANHNLLKDPPFSKMDLVSCRNVLIYLEPVLQKRALTTFHYALNEQGFLMLGKSESIGNNTELFAAYNNPEKIFRKKGIRGRFMQVTSQGGEQNFKDIDKKIQKEDTKKDVFKLADDLILLKYAPAGFLVNEHFDIVQFRGITDNWLDPSPGKASLYVLKMVREGLAFELRNLLSLAKKTNTPARKENVLYKLNNQQQYVNMEVTPILGAADPHYLVLFENGSVNNIRLPDSGLLNGKKKGPDPRDLEIEQLKRELMQARADMRSVTEEQEAVNEELQSANQELLSGGEELQSLNEELETSKEELQSTNEEITIVNDELLDRNNQLNNARTYTEGIINTIRDPLIILDQDLKVKRATNGFYHKFKVTEKVTEGRYFYDLGNHQWDIPALRELLESILPEKKIMVDFEVTHVFPNIGRRIMYLNARQLDRNNGDQLILLSIEDITDKRKVEEGLAEVELLFRENKDRLKLAMDATGMGTWDYKPLTGEFLLDSLCKQLFGLSEKDEINYDRFIELIDPNDKQEINNSLKKVFAGILPPDYVKEFRLSEIKNNEAIWIRFKGQAFSNAEGVVDRFVGTALDITAQKFHEQANLILLKKKDEFMSIASHELKTPLTSLKASLQVLYKMKDNPSPTMLPALIERANKSMDKIFVLVDDLLDASKFNEGQIHLNKSQFNLADMVEDCCQQFRTEKNYNITVEGAKNLQIIADANRVEQVVVNFINNAFKYAPDSQKIQILLEKKDTFIKVSVTDFGPGIAPGKIPFLFDRYYRVDSAGGQYSGLGLGLYISSGIIKKHKGEIGVTSELGRGSSFWFTLPVSSSSLIALTTVNGFAT